MGTGKLYVVSAPSGAGKTTVVKGALKKLKAIERSISWTTREPREGEKEGKDYRFVSRKEFEKLIYEKKLLEWAEVFGEYYGTPVSNIDEAKRDKVDLFLVIDVQGAKQIRKKMSDSILIFILPPSMEDLKMRLQARGKETEEEINKRLKEAQGEINCSEDYDFRIINEDLDKAVGELVNIISKEREQ